MRSDVQGYPPRPENLPGSVDRAGPYVARFATDAGERDASFRLRYEVFNLELNEGLETSHATGMDRDAYDDHCHHLIVEDSRSGSIIGTYRMQTAAHAMRGAGLYSATEFDFSAVPADFLDQAVELGRACIHRKHRSGRVLYLLWRGLARYMLHNRQRYFFGCCSLTSQDPAEGVAALQKLEARGQMHPTMRLPALGDYRCEVQDTARPRNRVAIPRLMRTYLDHGATICSEPAIDRAFGTIDFLAVLDVEDVDERARRLFMDS